MSRPKFKLQTTRTDWILEVIGLLGIILTVVYVIINFNDLPDLIPRHYNLSGQPDGFSGKSILFTLPAVTIVIYLILSIGLRFPHIFNYPFEITDENVERQYKNLTLMVRIFKMLIVLIFFYLTYATIQNGLGKMHGLGTWFTPLALSSVLGLLGFFIYKGYRLQ